jgi:serpin B
MGYPRWKVVLLLAAALGVSATVIGCMTPTVSGVLLVPSGQPQSTDSSAEPGDGLTAAINDFGLELVLAASTGEKTNVIVSPLSVHAALSMTANGATGETAEQMREVLRTDTMSPEDANAQWALLLTGLASRDTSQKLEIANSLWAREDVSFKKPFVDADRDYFGAQVSTLDFEKDDVAAAINGWVSKNTHAMITHIVNEVPDNAILYLANAVYFEGDWVTPFAHEATNEQPFTRSDGSRVDVEMMNSVQQMPYYESAALQATKLTYKGDATACYVMLPKQGVSLDAALATVEGTGFAKMRESMTSRGATEVIFGLPKLNADFSTDLKEPLSSMGMPRAFDSGQAQFSDMADLPVPIYIGKVLHKAKTKVDERGTVAAAATVVEMLMGSAASVTEPPRIVCDRPYAFAIVDERSGAMLFLGTINDPNE